MKLLMYGVNKETIMKEDVDKYRLFGDQKQIQMNDISQFDGVEEIIVLTNDFRNEYYLYVNETIFSHGDFLRYIADKTDKTLQEIILETYSKFNEDVLRHLYEISSGYLSEPVGSFDVLASVEKAVHYAIEMNTAGEVLYRLFEEAIDLAYYFKLNEEIQPLNKSKISKYIYLLQKKMKSLAKKHFLISGNDFEVGCLTKLLLLAGAQSITIIQKDEKDSLKQAEKISGYLTEVEAAKLFAATSKSLYYRLSKTDAAIYDSSEIDLFDEKTKEEVSIIRQTKKIQYLIDTADDPIKDIHEDKLDLHVIDATVNLSYNEEQLNNAIIALDEEIQKQIECFMKYFKDLQVEDIQGITQ